MLNTPILHFPGPPPFFFYVQIFLYDLTTAFLLDFIGLLVWYRADSVWPP